MRMKRAFKMKSKAFFIIFEGPSLKQNIFLEGEIPTLRSLYFSEIRHQHFFEPAENVLQNP